MCTYKRNCPSASTWTARRTEREPFYQVGIRRTSLCNPKGTTEGWERGRLWDLLPSGLAPIARAAREEAARRRVLLFSGPLRLGSCREGKQGHVVHLSLPLKCSAIAAPLSSHCSGGN